MKQCTVFCCIHIVSARVVGLVCPWMQDVFRIVQIEWCEFARSNDFPVKVAAAHQKHIDIWKALIFSCSFGRFLIHGALELLEAIALPNVDEYNQEMWKLE